VRREKIQNCDFGPYDDVLGITWMTSVVIASMFLMWASNLYSTYVDQDPGVWHT
jgi:hypothetical protein